METNTSVPSYYNEQLNKLDLGSDEFPPIVQIRHGHTFTKWLNLNDESANELVKWLENNYNITT